MFIGYWVLMELSELFMNKNLHRDVFSNLFYYLHKTGMFANTQHLFLILFRVDPWWGKDFSVGLNFWLGFWKISSSQVVNEGLDLLYPNIRMHNLHAILYIFPKVLTRRICFSNQEPLCLVIISLLKVWFRGDIERGNKMPLTLRGH